MGHRRIENHFFCIDRKSKYAPYCWKTFSNKIEQDRGGDDDDTKVKKAKKRLFDGLIDQLFPAKPSYIEEDKVSGETYGIEENPAECISK